MTIYRLSLDPAPTAFGIWCGALTFQVSDTTGRRKAGGGGAPAPIPKAKSRVAASSTRTCPYPHIRGVCVQTQYVDVIDLVAGAVDVRTSTADDVAAAALPSLISVLRALHEHGRFDAVVAEIQPSRNLYTPPLLHMTLAILTMLRPSLPWYRISATYKMALCAIMDPEHVQYKPLSDSRMANKIFVNAGMTWSLRLVLTPDCSCFDNRQTKPVDLQYDMDDACMNAVAQAALHHSAVLEAYDGRVVTLADAMKTWRSEVKEKRLVALGGAEAVAAAADDPTVRVRKTKVKEIAHL